MERMTIPKFENETDEANWAYENREELSAAFHEAVLEGRIRQGTLKRRALLEAELIEALQGEALAISLDELKGRTLVAVLREKLDRENSTDKRTPSR
jgi:hypothetical protein